MCPWPLYVATIRFETNESPNNLLTFAPFLSRILTIRILPCSAACLRCLAPQTPFNVLVSIPELIKSSKKSALPSLNTLSRNLVVQVWIVGIRVLINDASSLFC